MKLAKNRKKIPLQKRKNAPVAEIHEILNEVELIRLKHKDSLSPELDNDLSLLCAEHCSENGHLCFGEGAHPCVCNSWQWRGFSKFKHWLIKKLGGHIKPIIRTVDKVEKTEIQTITIGADAEIHNKDIECPEFKEKILLQLANDLACKIISYNLCDIAYSQRLHDETTIVRATLCIVSPKRRQEWTNLKI